MRLLTELHFGAPYQNVLSFTFFLPYGTTKMYSIRMMEFSISFFNTIANINICFNISRFHCCHYRYENRFRKWELLDGCVLYWPTKRWNSHVTCQHFEQTHNSLQMKWTIIAREMRKKTDNIKEGNNISPFIIDKWRSHKYRVNDQRGTTWKTIWTWTANGQPWSYLTNNVFRSDNSF